MSKRLMAMVPKETKAQLMLQVVAELQRLHPNDPEAAILRLSNYFTGYDLHGILSDLKEGK